MNSEPLGASDAAPVAAPDALLGVAPETTETMKTTETMEATEQHSRPLPRSEADAPPPVIRVREEHIISRRNIDPDALKALYRLSRNNYIAYLVGGSVRDLLLGRRPKDFDISTNARPEQIRALFRNCILIGRRFRLAHIRYGDKIIETSTFRRTPENSGDPADPQADLFQRDDNLFGTPREDALRRDFTVNGLFYDIGSFSIIDYVGGLEDLAARRIRSIGDPCIRFREDPVRMVRAIRFASRLDFDFDPDTFDAICRHGIELSKASPARLLEEITRLFAFSSGEKAVRLLRSTGLLEVILPEAGKCLDDERFSRELFWKRLEALDRGDTVLPDATPALIFAVLLLDPLKRHLGREWTAETFPRLKFEKIHAFLEPLALRLRFPRKLVDRIVHMYLAQNRFVSPGGKAGAIANFVTQDSFHESLALAEICLTAEGGSPARLNQWRDMLLERMYSREEGTAQDRRQAVGVGNVGGGSASAGGSVSGNGREDEVRARNNQGGNQVIPQGGGQGNNRESGEGNGGEGGEANSRLSRSARRRRNKKLRRQRDRTEPARREESANGAANVLTEKSGSDIPPSATSMPQAAQATQTAQTAAQTTQAVRTPAAPAAQAPAAAQAKPSAPSRRREVPASAAAPTAAAAAATPPAREPIGAASMNASPVASGARSVPEAAKADRKKTDDGNRRRRGRGGRKRDVGTEASSSSSSASASTSSAAPQSFPASPEEHFHPLTAAAFYRPPAPPAPPALQPEESNKGKEEKQATDKADKAEKTGRKRTGRKKDDARGGSGKEKGGAARERSGAGESARFEAPRPLREDKADEADRPMHWLDEI